MADKKNNNTLYTILVVVALLLILIPFFVFDASGHGLGHFKRFALHVLSFGAALAAGALFSSAVTSAVSSSVAGMKIAVWTGAAILTAGITYNTVQYIQNNPDRAQLLTAAKDTTTTVELPKPDSIIAVNTNPEDSSNSSINISDENNIPGASNNVTTTTTSTTSSIDNKKSEISSSTKTAITTTTGDKKSTDKNSTTNPGTVVNSNNNPTAEQCNSFQVLQGNKLLDRKLGLSIYDPNKMIRFNNDCGCVLKDATMGINRDGKIIETKSQSGNYVNWRGFKDINIGDKLEIEIKQANCKDSKGALYLYSFPKPILTIIHISDHMEFEGSDKKTTTTQKTPTKTAPAKTFEKDKVEEEYNKY